MADDGHSTRSARLDATEGEPVADRAEGIAAGTSIGRYVVLSEVGRGAMGVVYAAYDPELDRKVALKIMFARREELPMADEARARLVREAKALARLDHTNVVTVHDVGRHDESVFLAMEFVAGQTLSQWLEAAARSWRDVVTIFLAAGRGLAAVHAAGLVHRDFKPDNVMVTPLGRVVVMDFGLTRPGDDPTFAPEPTGTGSSQSLERVTLAGLTPGTPAYMSPEQHDQASTDPRSDQFSFCVALYEALYGHHPFGGTSVAAIATSIFLDEPRLPPKHTSVPTWLHQAVVRGLAKRPQDRFGSMDAVLEHLQADPRRTWRRAALAGSVVLVGLASWGAVELDEQSRAAACERAGASIDEVWDDGVRHNIRGVLLGTGLSYAPGTWDSVARLLSDYADDWHAVKTRLCLRARVEDQWSDERYQTASACLDSRKAGMSALVELLLAADGETTVEAVSAAANLRRPQACEHEAEAHPGEPTRPEVALERQRLERADTLRAARKYDEAVGEVEAVLAQAHVLADRPLVVEALVVRGLIALARAQHEAAETDLEAAFFGALAIDHDAVAARAAIALVKTVGRWQARHDDGLQWARHAEAALRRIRGPTELRWAGLFKARARVHQGRGDFEAARADNERALAILRARLGPHHPSVAAALEGIGNAYYVQGMTDKAFVHQQEVLEIREHAYGPEHPVVTVSLNNLGIARSRAGDYDEAQALFERSLELRRRAYGKDHTMIANSLHNLGDLLINRGELEEAMSYLSEALAMRERLLGGEHPAVADTIHNIGFVLMKQRAYRTAITHLERAVAIQRISLPPNHARRAPVLRGLARARLELGEHEAAIRLYEQAIAIEDQAGFASTSVAKWHFHLAKLVWKHDRDRRRARQLATTARDRFDAGGEAFVDQRDQVDAWLDGTASGGRDGLE